MRGSLPLWRHYTIEMYIWCHENSVKENLTLLLSVYSKAIPIKYFVSHRPTDPFFWKSKKKFRITCNEASTLVYKHTILSY